MQSVLSSFIFIWFTMPKMAAKYDNKKDKPSYYLQLKVKTEYCNFVTPIGILLICLIFPELICNSKNNNYLKEIRLG